jgi:hypothetical protein
MDLDRIDDGLRCMSWGLPSAQCAVGGVRTRLTEDNAKTRLTGVMPAVAGGFLAAAEGCGSSRDSGRETGGAGGASGSDAGTGDAAKEVSTGGSSGGGAAGSAGAGGGNVDGTTGWDGCSKFCSGALCASSSFCIQNGDGA